MEIIPREAGRITYSTEIRSLKKLSFKDIQKELIVGSLLGDGHLCENWSKTNYRLKISQARKQEDYVSWKYDILKDFVLTEPRLHTSTNSVRFATISHPELTNFHSIFYQGRKKIIPKNISNLLSPLVVAIWFMDDGNIRKSNSRVYGYYINSQSFTFKDNINLASVLKEKFGIECLVLKNRGYRLYIGKDREGFRNLVNGYIIPSLQYKLG